MQGAFNYFSHTLCKITVEQAIHGKESEKNDLTADRKRVMLPQKQSNK